MSWNDLIANLVPMTPELFLLGALCVLLIADLYIEQPRRGLTHFLAVAILVLTALLTLRGQPAPGAEQIAFGGMFVRDGFSELMKLAIYLVTIVTFVFAKPYLDPRGLYHGEFYVLVLCAVLGMMLLVSAGNLLMVYLGLELLALSQYALVGLDRDSPVSAEAAMKYFVLGALSSGMLLYGMSMIYGATGSLGLDAIDARAAAGYERTMLAFGLAFAIVGIAFKLGAAPFHMWVPDVYEGAPTAVTLFIGSAPKIAAFGMAYRLLEDGLSNLAVDWQQMLALLAIASLAIGNLVAIVQVNLKRMLAYSTIGHIGFLLLGLMNGTPEGYAAATFYVVTYALTATASFGMIILLSRSGFEGDAIDDFRGLNQRSPWYALMMLMIMASSAGIPIWVGFVAKFQVLKAAIDAGWLWLAIAAAVFAVIGAYYYLRVIKVMYFDEPKQPGPLALHADMPFRFVLSANGLALLALGLASGPLMRWCFDAVAR